MKIKVILLLMFSLLIVGCIENQSSAPKSTETKVFIPQSNAELAEMEINCGIDTTSLQKTNCINQFHDYINNKYVNWEAEVIDVKDDCIEAKIIDSGQIKSKDGRIITIGRNPVRLYDVEQQVLEQLKPNQKIQFSGQIILGQYRHGIDKLYSELSWSEFNILYNVKIEGYNPITPTQAPKAPPCNPPNCIIIP